MSIESLFSVLLRTSALHIHCMMCIRTRTQRAEDRAKKVHGFGNRKRKRSRNTCTKLWSGFFLCCQWAIVCNDQTTKKKMMSIYIHVMQAGAPADKWSEHKMIHLWRGRKKQQREIIVCNEFQFELADNQWQCSFTDWLAEKRNFSIRSKNAKEHYTDTYNCVDKDILRTRTDDFRVCIKLAQKNSFDACCVCANCKDNKSE